MAIEYNGVELSYVLTQTIEQENVPDPSGADRLYTRFVIRVTALLNADLEPAEAAEKPAATMKRVEDMLMAKRKPLTYTAPDGTAYFDELEFDDKNGPNPLYANVTQITQGTWHIAFGIEVHLLRCEDNPTPAWLSHRWTETNSYDKNWLATKRRSGFLVLSSRNDNLDSFRGMITPAVPAGFRRETADYTISEDGLTIRFNFLDKQLVCPPPLPSTKLTGKMVESLPLPGAVRYGDITLRLEGPPGVDTRELLNAGIRIAVSRALAAGVVTDRRRGRFLIGGSIGESLNDDENAVEISLRWQMQAVSGRKRGASGVGETAGRAIGNAGARKAAELGRPGQQGTAPTPNEQSRDIAALPMGYAGWLGAPLAGCNPDRSVEPPLYGLADHVKLIGAALNDPCAQAVTIEGELEPVLTENNLIRLRTLLGTFVDVFVSNDVPDDEADLYDDDTPGAYDVYKVTSHYTRDEGLAVLPSTKAGEKASKVRLHNPLMTMRAEWSCTRTGGIPTIPDPQPPSELKDNIVYVGGTVSEDEVDLAADGVSLTYTVSGVYNYGYLDADKGDVIAPVPPFLEKGIVNPEARLAASQLSTEILFYAGGAVNPFVRIVELRGGPRADG